MKFLFAATVLALASATVHRENLPQLLEQFESFAKTHGKTYKTASEKRFKTMVFAKNLRTIAKHNMECCGAIECTACVATSEHTHWLKVGPFADLTPEEFKRDIVGGCFMNATKEAAPGGVHTEKKGLKIPDAVDWSAKAGIVTPVKNQGQCGSCWAFSTTGAIESRYAIAKGQLNSLSEQELVDCSSAEGNQGCNGGLMDNGFKFVVKEHGLCTEDEYPYKAVTERQCKENKCKTIDDPIKTYKDVTRDNENALAQAVAEGPVSVAIEADQASFQHYSGGIMSARCGKRLDHGVLAVGYGADSGTKFWKVKNSWGASWGDKGYIKLCRECNKNFKAGQCGIAAQPSFPVV